jgi:hypothetical protein
MLRRNATKAMDVKVNQETVNDAAKLMMHRLIARKLGHDPSLVERAKISQAKIAERFVDRIFVREWDELLTLPTAELRAKLVSRDSDMVRLRISSPFVLAEGVDFTDYDLRLRIRRAAKRVAERGLGSRTRRPAMAT